MMPWNTARRVSERPRYSVFERKPVPDLIRDGNRFASQSSLRRSRRLIALENASNKNLVDRVTDHRGEFAHHSIGHLAGRRDLALTLEFRDRGLGVRTNGAGGLQLAVAIFGQRTLYRRHAARTARTEITIGVGSNRDRRRRPRDR